MKRQSPFPAASSLLAIALAGRSLAAAEVETDHKEPKRAKLGAMGRLSSTYSTNVYREQRRRLDRFDRLKDPGERFHGMSGPQDLVTKASIGGYYTDPLEKKREAFVSLSAGYAFFFENGIANYFYADLATHYDISRQDRVALDVEGVPHRFKKNYAIREVNGNPYFDHTYYWELDAEPSWRHGWTKRFDTLLAYDFDEEHYLDPFGNRSTFSHGPLIEGIYDFGRVEPFLGVGAAIGTTPSGLEFGVPIERSYRDLEVLAGVDVKLGSGFDAGARAKYRNRYYTTDEPLNLSYFKRTDQRWTFGLEGRKHFGKALALFCKGGFETEGTNRRDHPNLPPEDLGFDEWTIGLGVEGRL